MDDRFRFELPEGAVNLPRIGQIHALGLTDIIGRR
jgi:hypothetical protein